MESILAKFKKFICFFKKQAVTETVENTFSDISCIGVSFENKINSVFDTITKSETVQEVLFETNELYTETVKIAEQTVEEVLKPVTEQVEQTVEEVLETVKVAEQTVKLAEQTVEEVLEPVTEQVLEQITEPGKSAELV